MCKLSAGVNHLMDMLYESSSLNDLRFSSYCCVSLSKRGGALTEYSVYRIQTLSTSIQPISTFLNCLLGFCWIRIVNLIRRSCSRCGSTWSGAKMIAIDLVQRLVNMAALPFTSYFFPPCVRLLLGLPWLRLALGLSGAPFCFGSFSPLFFAS